VSLTKRRTTRRDATPTLNAPLRTGFDLLVCH
jgi:hypothetical protein